MRDLWLWHLNSVVACGIEFPDQGLNLGPLHREHGVLATGSPEKLLMRPHVDHSRIAITYKRGAVQKSQCDSAANKFPTVLAVSLPNEWSQTS
ncbi:hypothetical protein R6Z07F_014902 [Ovis aries]